MNKSKTRVEHINWKGSNALKICAGGYEALLVPEVGANMIELKNESKGLNLLRSPVDDLSMEQFVARPQVYGIPVLFPPNRIKDGRFTAAGIEYNLPINDKAGNNFIHGFLHKIPWEVAGTKIEEEKAGVEVIFKADCNTSFYEIFPHEFTARVRYALSGEGLHQVINIRNDGGKMMPMGLGLHTAFNIPFHTNGKADTCRIKLTIDREWELSEKLLPTGRLLEPASSLRQLTGDGIPVQGEPITVHFTSKPILTDGKEFNGAIIEDPAAGFKIIYEAGTGYKNWVLWNSSGNEGFICPEPQTWAINAPNIKLPEDITGFKMLSPGEEWQEFTFISVSEL